MFTVRHTHSGFLCLGECLTGLCLTGLAMATKAAWKYPGKRPATDKGWQVWIMNVKSPADRDWIPLGGGLVLCLEVGGGKTFQARIRRKGETNARRINIGHFPDCSVDDARQRLAEARSVAKEKKDPAVERRRAREGIEKVATFAQLIDRYLASRAANSKLRPKTLLIETQALELVRRALGDRLLTDIETRDGSAVVEREAARLLKKGRSGRSANITLAAAKRVFRYGRRTGLFTGPNPFAEIERPADESARDRILHDGRVLCDMERPELNELGCFVAALKSLHDPGPDRGTRAALLIGLMLGMRAGEVAALEWLHVRLDDATLLISTGKTAAARRLLPLPSQAMAIFRSLRAAAAHSERYVFASRSGAGRRPHLHAESLSRAFSRLCTALEIEGAVLHDCRRTAATGLVELTNDPELVEKILGHKVKTTLGRVYDHSRQLGPMLAALSAWADVIDDAAARAAPLALPPPLVALPAPSTEARS